MLEMLVTKSVKPFLHSFQIILQKTEAGKEELLSSLQAVKLFFFIGNTSGGDYFYYESYCNVYGWAIFCNNGKFCNGCSWPLL